MKQQMDRTFCRMLEVQADSQWVVLRLAHLATEIAIGRSLPVHRRYHGRHYLLSLAGTLSVPQAVKRSV